MPEVITVVMPPPDAPRSEPPEVEQSGAGGYGAKAASECESADSIVEADQGGLELYSSSESSSSSDDRARRVASIYDDEDQLISDDFRSALEAERLLPFEDKLPMRPRAEAEAVHMADRVVSFSDIEPFCSPFASSKRSLAYFTKELLSICGTWLLGPARDDDFDPLPEASQVDALDLMLVQLSEQRNAPLAAFNLTISSFYHRKFYTTGYQDDDSSKEFTHEVLNFVSRSLDALSAADSELIESSVLFEGLAFGCKAGKSMAKRILKASAQRDKRTASSIISNVFPAVESHKERSRFGADGTVYYAMARMHMVLGERDAARKIYGLMKSQIGDQKTKITKEALQQSLAGARAESEIEMTENAHDCKTKVLDILEEASKISRVDDMDSDPLDAFTLNCKKSDSRGDFKMLEDGAWCAFFFSVLKSGVDSVEGLLQYLLSFASTHTAKCIISETAALAAFFDVSMSHSGAHSLRVLRSILNIGIKLAPTSFILIAITVLSGVNDTFLWNPSARLLHVASGHARKSCFNNCDPDGKRSAPVSKSAAALPLIAAVRYFIIQRRQTGAVPPPSALVNHMMGAPPNVVSALAPVLFKILNEEFSGAATQEARGASELAHRAFFPAVMKSGWSKNIWIEGLRAISGVVSQKEMEDMLRLMEEKGLRVRLCSTRFGLS